MSTMGGTETIKRCRPTICFEFEHDGCGKNAAGDSLEDFYRFLGALNYDIKQAGPDFVAVPR
jgi:hypothetical protein